MFVRVLVVLLLAIVCWAAFARPSDGASQEGVYTVRPGDTLWSIAVAHYAGDPREAVWRLRERNGMEGVMLQPGQRLVLPTP
jgi:LysM repeat protein